MISMFNLTSILPIHCKLQMYNIEKLLYLIRPKRMKLCSYIRFSLARDYNIKDINMSSDSFDYFGDSDD
jgi:hypothetical protein